MLRTTFLGTRFANPFIIPSGIIPEIPDTLRAEVVGAGGVVAKTLTVLPREGNPMPRVIRYEYGVLNSVGLRNPGMVEGTKKLEPILAKATIPVIVSIFATSVGDFVKVAEETNKLKPAFLELNLSCPNVTSELGESMGMATDSTFASVSAVRKVVSKKTHIIAKLSPNIGKIGEIAKAAEQAGADAIAAINTVGPGMVIDIKTRKPMLGNKEGGVSGPGIRPVAIRCVYDVYKSVKIPIIGMGGIETWQDAVEIMMAGATLVGVGSAIYRHGYGVIKTIADGIEEYMKKEKIASLSSLVGAAHK